MRQSPRSSVQRLSGALKHFDCPNPCARRRAPTEAMLLKDGGHCCRRMDVCPKCCASNLPPGVGSAHKTPHVPASSWKRKAQKPASMLGCRREQTEVVGIATHDAVEGHHVRRWDVCGHVPKVGMMERHPVSVAQALRLFSSDREICCRCIE